MNGIAASTSASGARLGRTRIARPISTPATSSGCRRRRCASSHNAAVRMSFIGCTAWIQHDRARRREDRRRRAGHAAGKLPRDHERRQHQDERGDRRQPEDRILPEHRGERRHQHRHARRANRRRRIGVNRRRNEAAGRERHATRPATARHGQRAVRLQLPARERLRHQRVAGRIRSADRPRAAHDAERRQRQRHRQRPATAATQRPARRSLGEGGSF